MNNLEYKNYIGSIDYNSEDNILFGKIEFINALVLYEGRDVKSLKRAFEEAVEDYLQYCADKKIEPEKPFKGSFNVRIEPNLHRQAARCAKQNGQSLNAVVSEAIKNYVQGQSYV